MDKRTKEIAKNGITYINSDLEPKEKEKLKTKPKEKQKQTQKKNNETENQIIANKNNFRNLIKEIDEVNNEQYPVKTFVNCDLRYFNMNFLVEKLGYFDSNNKFIKLIYF